MKYEKYHGLGNDYLVIRPSDVDGELDSKQIQLICHRNYGVGSDGVLLGPLPSDTCNFRLRILNPDGGGSSIVSSFYFLKSGIIPD